MRDEGSTARNRSGAGMQTVSMGLLLGYVELHAGSMWLPMLLLLPLFTFILGVDHPKAMPHKALLVGACIPAAHVLGWLLGYSIPHALEPAGLVLAMGIAWAGAYTGVAVRRFYATRMVLQGPGRARPTG